MAGRRGVRFSSGVRYGLRALGAGALAAGMGVGSAALGAPAAGAVGTNVHCGEVIVTSTTLTGTLTCRSYDGTDLTIGASGVTLNLAGHTIFARSTFELRSYGIAVVEKSHVTIESGTIQTANYGVVAYTDTYLTVTGLHVFGHTEGTYDNYGMYFGYVAGASITGSTAAGETVGFGGYTIRTSTISGNTASTGSLYSNGFDLGNLTNDVIVKNVADYEFFDGFYLYGALTTDTVSANRGNYDGYYGLDGNSRGTRPRGINIDIGDPSRCFTILCIIPGHGGGTGGGEAVPYSPPAPRRG